MPPSLALRLGRIYYPKVSNEWQSEEDKEAFCALGLINYIRGDELYGTNGIDHDTGHTLFKYPCNCVSVFDGHKDSPTEPTRLGVIVMHLSDYHDYFASRQSRWDRIRNFRNPIQRWTQNDIIDWLVRLGY